MALLKRGKKKKDEVVEEAVTEVVETEQVETETNDETQVEEKVAVEAGSFEEWWETVGLKIVKKDVSRKTLIAKALKAGNDASELSVQDVNEAIVDKFGDEKPSAKDVAEVAFNLGK